VPRPSTAAKPLPGAGLAPCPPAVAHKKTKEKRQAPVPTHAKHATSQPPVRGSEAQLATVPFWTELADTAIPGQAADDAQATSDFPNTMDDGDGASDTAQPEALAGAEPAMPDAGATRDSDAALESGLAALGGNDGIFELLLPGGGSVGVVVNADSRRTSFLLQASESQLGERLRQNRLELERGLQRRMQANVEIAVL
jgi:hypothetical protein